jgi:predicted dehydrogenase
MPNLDRRRLLSLLPAAAGSLALTNFARGALAPKIIAAQIGTAHAHAAGKIATLRKLSDHYQVIGVVEPDDARWAAAQKNAAYQDVPRLTEEQLLNRADLQLVAVETEVGHLVPTAHRCVAAGKHIHLDKPAGETLSPFKALHAEAARQQVAIQMGYMFRYNPAFEFLFAAVADGWLGEVFEVHGVMSKTVGAATRRELARFAGGAMFELGCHLIDALVFALGKPLRVTPYVRRTRAATDRLADNQLAVFEYEQATATIRSALMEVDGFRRRQFVVCGSGGTIEIKPLEPPRLTLTLAQPRGEFAQGTHVLELLRPAGRYDGDFLDLAQVIRGEKSLAFTPEHDLAVQEALLRASGVEVK